MISWVWFRSLKRTRRKIPVKNNQLRYVLDPPNYNAGTLDFHPQGSHYRPSVVGWIVLVGIDGCLSPLQPSFLNNGSWGLKFLVAKNHPWDPHWCHVGSHWSLEVFSETGGTALNRNQVDPTGLCSFESFQLQ